jgi:hypothetical protein
MRPSSSGGGLVGNDLRFSSVAMSSRFQRTKRERTIRRDINLNFETLNSKEEVGFLKGSFGEKGGVGDLRFEV